MAAWVALMVTGFALVAIIGALLREAADRGWLLVMLLSCAAWSAMWFWGLGASSLPTELLNPLQEGLTGQTIRHLYGDGVHAGDGFRAIAEAYAAVDGGGRMSLRTAVGMNVWLAGLNAILFLVVAWKVLGHMLGALLFAVAYCSSVPFIQATISEGPGQLLSFFFFVGLLFTRALLGLDQRRWRGVALCGLWGVLMTAISIRLEMLVAALLCGGMALLLLLYSEQQIVDGSRRLLQRIRGSMLWDVARRAPMTLAFVVGLALYIAHLLLASSYWLAAMSPIDVHALYIPLVLIDMMSPVVIVLFVFGVWFAFFRLHRFLLLPIMVLVLFKTYYAASHNGHLAEMTRYTTYYLPCIFVLALFGWRQLVSVAEQGGWFKGWRVLVAFLIGLAAVPDLSIGRPGASVTPDTAPGQFFRGIVGLGDQQAEAQFLVDLTEQRPQCIVAAQVAETDGVSSEKYRALQRNRLVLFGAPIGDAEVHPIEVDLLAGIRRAVNNRAPCVLAYEGLDCSLELDGGPTCDLAQLGLPIARSVVVHDAGYYSHVVSPSPVRLTAYTVQE